MPNIEENGKNEQTWFPRARCKKSTRERGKKQEQKRQDEKCLKLRKEKRKDIQGKIIRNKRENDIEEKWKNLA